MATTRVDALTGDESLHGRNWIVETDFRPSRHGQTAGCEMKLYPRREPNARMRFYREYANLPGLWPPTGSPPSPFFFFIPLKERFTEMGYPIFGLARTLVRLFAIRAIES